MAKKTENKKTGTDQAPRELRREKPAPKVNKRRSTSWKVGQCGNPKGRPKSGESLAEAVRESVSTKALLDRMKWLADHAESETVRFHALSWLAERGHGKAPLEVTVHRGNAYSKKVKDLTDEQLMALALLDEPAEPDEPTPSTGLN